MYKGKGGGASDFLLSVCTSGQRWGGGRRALPPFAVAGQALHVLERQFALLRCSLAELAADLARRAGHGDSNQQPSGDLASLVIKNKPLENTLEFPNTRQKRARTRR